MVENYQEMLSSEHSGFIRHNGIRVVSVDEEKSVLTADVTPENSNIWGGVHGGFYATVIDTITGGAIHTMLEAGINFGTIDLNVKMIRALQANQTYRAEAEVITIGRTLLTAEGRIIGDDGKIHAFGSASCLVIK